MKTCYAPLLFAFCVLALNFLAYCSSAATDSQVLLEQKDSAKLDLNDKSSAGSVLDPDILKGKDELNKPIDGVKSGMNNTDSSSWKSGPIKGENVTALTEKEKSKEQVIAKEDGSDEKTADGLKPKEQSKAREKEEIALVKENSPPHEECDASNWCNDEDNHLIACLRIPGNDSPELSLLIQNKGSGSLTVRISSPDNVHLEATKIQLLQKESHKVKVSIIQGGLETLIILKFGVKGICKLDFKEMVTHNSGKEADTRSSSKYAFLLNNTPYFVIVLLVLLVLIGSALVCVRIKHKHFPTADTKYQKLDMELPVTGGSVGVDVGVGVGKADSDASDGWDNGWDDNWDDEEAPKTPSMPVTPSLSSKGLASRRSNKEGWKD